MKRMILVISVAALLIACAGTPAEPVVEPDARAAETPAAVEEDTIGAETPAEQPTEAPAEQPTEALAEQPTEAPAEQPTEAPAQKSFAQRVADAWADAGFLNDMAPYSDVDLLDLYGIDLSACISGAGFADAVSYVNEAVVVEADEATAAAVEQLLKDHLEAVREQFRSYDADAYALAEKAVLVRDGGTVLMIVSPDAEAMRAVFAAVDR